TPVAETVVGRGWVSADDLAQVLSSLSPGAAQAQAPAPVEPAPVEPAPVVTAPPAPEPVEPAPLAATPPAPDPAPAVVPPPAPEPARRPIAVDGAVRVIVRLRNGEHLDAGSYDEPTAARTRAHELVEEVQAEDAWPFVAGRSIAPEEIDTIFLEKR